MVTRFNESGELLHPVEAGVVCGPSYPSVIRVNCDITCRPPVHGFICKRCGRLFNWKQSLNYHVRMECGKEPQFKCLCCPH
jgi:hypothetical protein